MQPLAFVPVSLISLYDLQSDFLCNQLMGEKIFLCIIFKMPMMGSNYLRKIMNFRSLL